MVDLGDRQAIDIVAPACKKPDYPSQHASFIIDQNRERVRFLHITEVWPQIIGRML
jgi:hypothetical protein